MLNLKWLSGLALASVLTVAELPIVFPQSIARAQSVATTQPKPNLIARNRRSGRINVIYGETEDSLSAELIQGYQQYGIFERLGKTISSSIQLPNDITVVLADCEEANAAYLSRDNAIVMCNELNKHNYQLLRQHGYSKEEAIKTVVFASVFTFYHESAHMLVHQLKLPIVGKHEDVADQFAAFFLLANDAEDKSISGEIIMSAANIFALQSTVPEESDYQDEHSLNQQRFYNLVCMVYGAAPEQYSHLVAKLDYSESRLNRCESESKSIVTAWQRLLKPYLKA